MIINGRVVWISILSFILSFVVEFTKGYVSFFRPWLGSVFFWFSIGTAGLLVGLELFGRVYQFIDNNFQTPRKRLESIKNRIEGEQKKIKELLGFSVAGKAVEELREHYEELKEADISKEALAPYLLQWHEHADSIHLNIQAIEQKEDLVYYEAEKKTLREEIETLEKEKKRLEMSEKQLNKSKKEEFLEQEKDRLFFYIDSFNDEQKKWLEEEGFEKTSQWDIEYQKVSEMMIKRRSNESQSHAYLVYALYGYLINELGRDNVEMYETKMPDIVFSVNGFKLAIEVETGTQLQKNPNALKEKVAANNQKYGKDGWFFVVAKRDLAKKYREFADTVDRKGVLSKLDGIIWPEGKPDTPV